MNQRFQGADIDRVSEQYADNELYKAVSAIGPRFENELREFGLCPEECFADVLELLTDIAERGRDIISEVGNIWLRKENEYRRFDRRVGQDEIRKAVGIVFGFVVRAIYTSSHGYYNYTLAEALMQEAATHKWEGWTATLGQIFDFPLPQGWFDAFIDEEPEECQTVILPKQLNTPRARKYFQKAIEADYLEPAENGRYRWKGTNDKGNSSELAYFLGRVYNYVHTVSGNVGEDFPEESLNQLFGVRRLYSLLSQVYNAKKMQRWRSQIDALFE